MPTMLLEWFLNDPGASDGLRHLPSSAWVVTSEESAKYLRAAGSLEPFELVAHEGPLVLFHKIR